MPPKKDTFGTAQQWLKRAKGNLALAKQPKPKDREPETCELRNVCPYTAVFQPFVPEGSEKISKNRAYLVSQRILMRRSTDSNSGSPVKTVASSRWAVATQNASA